jgi:hypothetical protein
MAASGKGTASLFGLCRRLALFVPETEGYSGGES